jgi:hypothetical protein
MGSNIYHVPIFQSTGTFEELRFLIEVPRPGGPIVPGILDILANAMEGDLAAGTILDDSVPTDVITVGVGADDKPYLGWIYPKATESSLCFFEVGEIACVDENGLLGTIDKVVTIQVSALDEE